MYKILLTAAGVGSRIAGYSQGLNKGLISINDRPVYSHILERFPKEVPVVVVLGYQAELVRECIEMMHPDRTFEFVTVDRYEGEGSGLGRSILAAKSILQCPFVFTPNDCFPATIDWRLDPRLTGNWVLAVQKNAINMQIRSEYRGLSICNGKLDQLFVKGYESSYYYSGLTGVYDFEEFWGLLESEVDYSIGESAAIRHLEDVRVLVSDEWFDVGNPTALKETTKSLTNPNDFNILEKSGETIWFSSNQVTKVFSDSKIVGRRMERLSYLDSSLTPDMIQSGEYSYQYKMFEGDVLAKCNNRNVFVGLYDLMQEKIWSNTASYSSEYKREAVISFYKNKTMNRLELFIKTREYSDKSDFINGVSTPSVRELLGRIDWDAISDESNFAHFHGDFHAENILYSIARKQFCLIDWRDSFDKSVQFGDIYYDLAKFMHGLVVSHKAVADEAYFVVNDAVGYSIDIRQSFFYQQVEKDFVNWMAENGYSIHLVKVITALVFVNIAPLHHSPYDLFLLELGRSLLNEELLHIENKFIN